MQHSGPTEGKATGVTRPEGQPGHTAKFTPPHGATQKPDGKGGTIYKTQNGAEFHTGNKGQLTGLKTHGGTEATLGANGRVRSIHSGAMTINRGEHGARVVETRLSNGNRVVAIGPHRGFVEHQFERGGQRFVTRTYVTNRTVNTVVYRNYYYNGAPYYAYVPPYYYAPAFYSWAYTPWVAPVPWAWGWAADPWYARSGYYFQPYSTYAYPALWVTDFVLAENLRAAYDTQAAANAQAAASAQTAAANAQAAAANAQAAAANAQAANGAQVAANAPPVDAQAPADSGGHTTVADGLAPAPAQRQHAVAKSGQTTLTPEVKQAVAEEVKAQIAANEAAAHGAQAAAVASNDQVPEALDPKRRTFVVSTPLNEEGEDGSVCSLSSGDVLTRIGNTPDAKQNVQVLVTSSQSDDCQSGTQLAVSLQALQDMRNDFRQKIDAGLAQLAENQGKGGMPTGPAADRQPVEAGEAPADPDAPIQLSKLENEANTAEAEVAHAQEENGLQVVAGWE